MAFSPVGQRRLVAQVALFFANVTVLALAARVNQFQEFFFVADLFPLSLSIVTLILLTFSFVLDLGVENPFTARAPFEIGAFGLLSIFWLAFNSFSTSRWRHVPFMCNSIPNTYPDEITWCKDLQILKSFVWIECLMFFVHTLATLRYVITQHNLGNKHIWNVSLARYTPQMNTGSYLYFSRDSEFLQFEKAT